MWDTLERPRSFKRDLKVDNYINLKTQEVPWFKSLINTIKKYKDELFGGESYSSTCIRKQRMRDYTIPPNYKFVFARYTDGFYRPASIMGRSKKLHLFIVLFYHKRKCCYVKKRDILVKHGNLLDRKIFFSHGGEKKKGKVFGNNSPANDGFPSVFFVKRKDKWYRVNFRNIFLTKKQVNKFYFVAPKKKKSSNSISKSKSDMQEPMCS